MHINDSINILPGVGSLRKELLEKVGVKKIKDLIEYYPSRYEDTTKIVNISNLEPSDDKITIQGTIESIKNFRTKAGKKLTSAIVSDESGVIDVLWFNQHFLVKIIRPGRKVLLNGKVTGETSLKLISPTYEVISDYYDSTHLGRITPIYPETKGLTSKYIRKLIKDINKLINFEDSIKDDIPSNILITENLMPKHEAIQILHFPKDMEEIEKARKRMAFEEIFEILIKVKKEKEKQEKYNSPQINKDTKLISSFIKNLPFTPTDDQTRCIEEVLNDLKRNIPMHRLLEGDVGSGKTLVAIVATINTISQDYQVAILAPTQVLAEQHYKTFLKLAPWIEPDLQLVTSNTKINIKEDKETKSPKVLIGTHAILHQADNLLDKLGLIIIDEQHRFGVKQRSFLTEFIKEWSEERETNSQSNKEINIPHVLTMTATPIPRSLALTLYGDLDISVIEQMPKGRIPVETHVVPNNKRTDGYKWIRQQVNGGGQVFVICPLVEDSNIIDVKSATKEFEKLKNEIFPDLKIELLHGRIKADEKDRILTDFKKHKFDILVSTAVVEVGIDIPNATIIVIEGAERFGLAQLHQFRGRVGRSDKKSYCLLFTNSDSEDAKKRLNFFTTTNKGLEIAEYDLKRRGPGEVYGLRQSGIPDLKFANLLDLNLIKKVKKYL